MRFKWPRGVDETLLIGESGAAGFVRPADFQSIVKASEREAAGNLARAASVLLESSPKKGIHDDDIPLSVRMSGQSCTSRISTNTELGHHRFSEIEPWSARTMCFRNLTFLQCRCEKRVT